ncbi:hypothetical protein [Thalassospira marina]|uniref:Uncharacterized protein n=1 Tax=Thalassospira marina TaxID=2048283 RepID=A0A2N3KUM2_9PROT|nr:hypothetical protein [Thalassospira marina]PKR54238.1 hypothetical protein COO20_08810 [Thalassospira marina]
MRDQSLPSSFDENHCLILFALEPEGDEFVEFSRIKADRLGLEKREFLRMCRESRDMGFAVLSPTYNTDTGHPCGSAYVRTDRGYAALKAWRYRHAKTNQN